MNNHFKIIYRVHLILLFFILILGPTLDLKAQVRPDLFLDGEALANHITESLLRRQENEKTPAFKIDEEKKIAGIETHLLMGAEFSITGDRDFDWSKKEDVKDWMESIPKDRSISMPQFFDRCMLEMDNNVENALLLAWNVLSEDYQEADERNLFQRTLKLEDITGELDLFDGQNHIVLHTARGSSKPRAKSIKLMRGDNFSAWYHFFGTALSSFYHSKTEFVPGQGKVYTDLMIFGEEKLYGDVHFDSKKRIEIDKAGSQFGKKLYSNLTKYKSMGDFKSSKEAKKTHYLYDNRTVYGEKWRLRPGQHPRDYGTDKKSLKKDYKFLKQRFEYYKELVEKKQMTDKIYLEALSDDIGTIRSWAINVWKKSNFVTTIEENIFQALLRESDQKKKILLGSSWLSLLNDMSLDIIHRNLVLERFKMIKTSFLDEGVSIVFDNVVKIFGSLFNDLSTDERISTVNHFIHHVDSLSYSSRQALDKFFIQLLPQRLDNPILQNSLAKLLNLMIEQDKNGKLQCVEDILKSGHEFAIDVIFKRMEDGDLILRKRVKAFDHLPSYVLDRLESLKENKLKEKINMAKTLCTHEGIKSMIFFAAEKMGKLK